jgi:hypothetical protein
MKIVRRTALLTALAWSACQGTGAQAQSSEAAPAATAPGADAERQNIMASPRWIQALRNWNEWLSIQRTYTPEQVAALRAEINDRIAAMSPPELLAFLDEMEERLKVLMSPEADEARQWIGQILAVARNPESHFGGPLPDVAHMTAGQIRKELLRFQQMRGTRQQEQAAFDRSRQRQVQAAVDMQNAAAGGAAATPRAAATFPEPQIPYRSPYAGRPPRRAFAGPPVYRIGPWGEPIFWNPLSDWRLWNSRW